MAILMSAIGSLDQSPLPMMTTMTMVCHENLQRESRGQVRLRITMGWKVGTRRRSIGLVHHQPLHQAQDSPRAVFAHHMSQSLRTLVWCLCVSDRTYLTIPWSDCDGSRPESLSLSLCSSLVVTIAMIVAHDDSVHGIWGWPATRKQKPGQTQRTYRDEKWTSQAIHRPWTITNPKIAREPSSTHHMSESRRTLVWCLCTSDRTYLTIPRSDCDGSRPESLSLSLCSSLVVMIAMIVAHDDLVHGIRGWPATRKQKPGQTQRTCRVESEHQTIHRSGPSPPQPTPRWPRAVFAPHVHRPQNPGLMPIRQWQDLPYRTIGWVLWWHWCLARHWLTAQVRPSIGSFDPTWSQWCPVMSTRESCLETRRMLVRLRRVSSPQWVTSRTCDSVAQALSSLAFVVISEVTEFVSIRVSNVFAHTLQVVDWLFEATNHLISDSCLRDSDPKMRSILWIRLIFISNLKCKSIVATKS